MYWLDGRIHLNRYNLAGFPVYIGELLTGKIDEQLLAGLVLQNTAWSDFPAPGAIVLHKLSIEVAFGMLLKVFVP